MTSYSSRENIAAIIALVIGAIMASIGSYGINHPAECWPLASTLAFFYQVMLENGTVSMSDTQIGGRGWFIATVIYWCLSSCPVWFLIVPRNRGGGTSGRRIVR